MKIHNTYLFGKVLDKTSWTPEELEEVGLKAQAARELMRGASREYITSTLAAAGALFAPGGKYRKAALAHLKEHITFSAPVIEKSLDVIPEILEKQCTLAMKNLGIGKPVDAADAKRGDFVQFYRMTNGHSAVFLEWREVGGARVGLTYRSSQKSTGGIKDKTESFHANGGEVDTNRMYFGRLNEN